MIIREASLCLRFYTSDGWTRSDVAAMLTKHSTNLTPTHYYVCPRWFDNADCDRKYSGFMYSDNWEHNNCDYYAVYSEAVQFDEEKLKQHTIIPFGSIAV